MTFSSPIFLWSLLGLAVPMTIHFLSRKEGKVIRLGSVRHVVETSTQQFKGIRLNEILLLAVRCACIVVISLLLSGLQCSSPLNHKWVLVERGLERNAMVTKLIDSLSRNDFEVRQLADGFPAVGKIDSAEKLNYWRLAEDLRQCELSEVVVFASNKLENFTGMRVSLPENVKWIAVPISAGDFRLMSFTKKDTSFVRTGHSNADENFFTNEFEKAETMEVQESIKVLVVQDPHYAYDTRILAAALKAIQNSTPIELKLDMRTSTAVSTKMYDWCFWLSDQIVNRNLASKLVLIKPQSSSDLFIRLSANEWVITRRLNEETALKENLAIHLTSLIAPKEKLEEIVSKNERRVMPDSLAWSASKTNLKSEASIVTSPSDRYLILALLILLLAERLIAFQRKQ